MAESERSDVTVEQALERWRVEVWPLSEEDGGGWFAHFPAFGPHVAHGDGPTVERALADATVSLNLMVEVLTEEGEALPPNDADGRPPTVLPERRDMSSGPGPRPSFGALDGAGVDEELPYLGQFPWERHLDPADRRLLNAYRGTLAEHAPESDTQVFGDNLARAWCSEDFHEALADAEDDIGRAYALFDAELSAYPFTLSLDDEDDAERPTG